MQSSEHLIGTIVLTGKSHVVYKLQLLNRLVNYCTVQRTIRLLMQEILNFVCKYINLML